MTQQAAPGGVPTLTLGWRLRMALDYGDVSVQAMADQLGVARATLSRWMSDRGSPPKKAYVMQWALITGVPFEWIDTGTVTPEIDPEGSGHRVTRALLAQQATVVTLRDQSGWALAPNRTSQRLAA